MSEIEIGSTGGDYVIRIDGETRARYQTPEVMAYHLAHVLVDREKLEAAAIAVCDWFDEAEDGTPAIPLFERLRDALNSKGE